MSLSMKKARKKIRKNLTAIEKSVDRMAPGTNTAAKVTIAGAVAAAVAGGAAVVHHMRDRGIAKLDVSHDGAEWALRTDGADGEPMTFATKRKAVSAARKEAAAAAPSELVIHRVDGSVEQSHSYDLV